MALRLPGQTSTFGVVFFVSKSLLGIEIDPKALEPCYNIDISNVAYSELKMLMKIR